MEQSSCLAKALGSCNSGRGVKGLGLGVKDILGVHGDNSGSWSREDLKQPPSWLMSS